MLMAVCFGVLKPLLKFQLQITKSNVAVCAVCPGSHRHVWAVERFLFVNYI